MQEDPFQIGYPPGIAFQHVYDTRVMSDTLPADGVVSYRINQLGFRGREWALEKPAGMHRVLCVGDSFTFGEGVAENETLAAQLALQDFGPAMEWINCGVQGRNLRMVVQFITSQCAHYAPDAIWYFWTPNDFLPYPMTVEAHYARMDEMHKAPGWSRVLRVLNRAAELKRMKLEGILQFMTACRGKMPQAFVLI